MVTNPIKGGFKIRKAAIFFALIICMSLPAYCGQSSYACTDIVLSMAKKATLCEIELEDGDLVDYNSIDETANLIFSEDLFENNANIDAVHILTNGHIILSTTSTTELGGLSFKSGDLIEYDPAADSISLFLSKNLFDEKNTDIDAVCVLDNSHIILSTTKDATLGDLSFNAADLIEYDPNSKTATLFFSGDWLIGKDSDKNINAVHILQNGNIVLSNAKKIELCGLIFDADELVEYDPETDTAILYLENTCFSKKNDIDALYIAEPVEEEQDKPNITYLLGDLNFDGRVDMLDFAILSNNWLESNKKDGD